MLKKSGLVHAASGRRAVRRLGGLESLKAFCKRAIRPPLAGKQCPAARRAACCRRPAAAKSQFAKALGNETGRPTLVLDIGSLMGSLVGPNRSQHPPGAADRRRDGAGRAVSRRMRKGPERRGFQRPDRQRRLGPAVRHVSVVAQRPRVRRVCRGDLQRHLEAAAGICRAERFDGVFFLDLPDDKQRQAIWQIYVAQYQLDRSQQAAGGRSVDRRRDQSLLPIGGPAWICRSPRPPRTSCRWPARRPSRSRSCGSGRRALPSCRSAGDL